MRTKIVVLAVLAALLAASPVAAATSSQPSDPAAMSGGVVLEDVLDLLTYRIHTVLDRPGADIERTVPAVVGVPTPVNVDGGLLPDLVVTIVPLPPNLITVSFARTPTALGHLPLRAEVLVDVPGGIGASFGFDARAGETPPAFAARFTFGLIDGVDLDLFANTAFPSSTPTIALVAGLFTKGPDGTRVDPVDGRLDLTPVPGEMHLGVGAGGPEVRAEVDTSRPTKATFTATAVQGAVDARLGAVVDRLPDHVDVTATSGEGQTVVTYRASEPIRRVEADLLVRRQGAVVGHLDAHLGGVPTSVDVTVAGTRTDVVANGPVDVEAGFNRSAESPFEQGVTEAAYAVAELDSTLDRDGDGTRDAFVRRAALRVPGVRSVTVDTGDPMVVDAVSAGGALRARLRDTRPTGDFTLEGTVDALPGDARVEFSRSRGSVGYETQEVIEETTLLLDDPAGFAGFRGANGAQPTHVDATIGAIPGDVTVRFTPAGSTDPGRPLVDLDAGETGIGSIRVLFTSGPEPATTIPAGSDGVVVEDFADRFAARAQISSLKRLNVRSGGRLVERNGPVEARPVVHLDLSTAGGRPLFARLDQRAGDRDEFLEATLSNLPSSVSVDLFAFDQIPCAEFDEDFNLSNPVLASRDCEIFLETGDGEESVGHFDPDDDGFFNTPFTASDGSLIEPSIGVEARYSAVGTVDHVTLRTDAGDLPNEAFVHLEDVPTSVQLCLSRKETCSVFDNEREGLTFRLDASAPLTVRDVFLCQEPRDGSCVFDPALGGLTGPARLLKANEIVNAMGAGFFAHDLTVQNARLEFHSRENETTVIRLDTLGKPITGLFAVTQENVQVRAVLEPFEGIGGASVDGLVDIDALLKVAGFLPIHLDGDLSGFPGGALRAEGAEIRVKGLNLEFSEGLTCGERTNIDITAEPLPFDVFDLTKELCLPAQ